MIATLLVAEVRPVPHIFQIQIMRWHRVEQELAEIALLKTEFLWKPTPCIKLLSVLAEQRLVPLAEILRSWA